MDLKDLSSAYLKELFEVGGGLGLALHWASRGLPVLPTNPETKAPWVGKQWERQATTDLLTIVEWKPKWDAGARVGIKTGLACGCGCKDGPDVLDFDISEGKPGLDQLVILMDAGVIDPFKMALASTPSGGRHAWFCGSTQHNKQNDDAVWGVDLRAHHGMVLAPGNPGYRFVPGGLPHDEELGPSPVWAAVAACPGILQKTRPPSTGRNERALPGPVAPPRPPSATEGLRSGKLVAPLRGFDDAPDEQSPLDWYSRNHDMEAMLLGAGWKFAYEAQGKRYFVRPGKEAKDGVSGNIGTMADGRQVFYNFSSSTELPTDRAMSGGQLYAWLEHGGNMGAAAKQIRSERMPARSPAPTAPVIALGGPPANEQAPAGTDAPPGPPAPGRALVPLNESFWLERPELRNVRWLARQRRVSPWAMLGSVLALVSCRIGPHVVLPKIVGGNASLNLLVGLVGPSGKGKGASWAVALEYLDCEGKFPILEIATAQGIDSTFTETPPKSGPVQFNDVAFFYVPEIDGLKATSEANGGAVLPHLRKVWSGELLGGQTANKERRRPVRAHSYRASAVVGVQPARSAVLLNDADGGLPQRFVWMPVHDPNLLRRTDKLQPPLYSAPPPQTDYDVWIPAGEQRGEKDEPLPVEMKPRWEIPVAVAIENEVIDAREENLASEHGGMDSHALLTQLKVAALLAFWFGEYAVDLDHWRLARAIMKVSDKTRAVCERALAEAEREEHAKRGRNRAVQAVHEEIGRVVVRDERIDRVDELGNKLLDHLKDSPGVEFSPRELRILMGDARTGKEYWEDVRARLEATLGVVQGPEISAGGRRIRKLRWQPTNTP